MSSSVVLFDKYGHEYNVPESKKDEYMEKFDWKDVKPSKSTSAKPKTESKVE